MGERVQVQGHLMVLLRSGDRTFATRGHGLERRRPSPFLIILCRVVVSVRVQNTRFLERRRGSPFLIALSFFIVSVCLQNTFHSGNYSFDPP